MTLMRAKFQITSVNQAKDANGAIEAETLYMHAVYGEGKANKEWSKWTPSGSLTMNITNPNLFGKLKAGDYYFLDFTLTDKDG